MNKLSDDALKSKYEDKLEENQRIYREFQHVLNRCKQLIEIKNNGQDAPVIKYKYRFFVFGTYYLCPLCEAELSFRNLAQEEGKFIGEKEYGFPSAEARMNSPLNNYAIFHYECECGYEYARWGSY